MDLGRHVPSQLDKDRRLHVDTEAQSFRGTPMYYLNHADKLRSTAPDILMRQLATMASG
jgi:hypothetical protein